MVKKFRFVAFAPKRKDAIGIAKDFRKAKIKAKIKKDKKGRGFDIFIK